MRKSFTFLLLHTILFSVILLSSCTNITSLGVKKANDIDPDARNEISRMCHKIHNALKKRNSTYIKSIVSEKIKKNENILSIDTVVNSMNVDSSTNTYRVVGEYLMTALPNSIPKSVESNIGNFDNDYEFRFMGGYAENYVLLFTIPSRQNFDYLISCVFIKEKQEWKLGTFFVGYFKYNGKTAPDMYNEAKRQYSEHNYFGAYINLYTAYSCLQPAGEHFKYDLEKEIKQFVDSFRKDFTANGGEFPYKINLPGSKHSIEFLSFGPVEGAKHIYPVILYKSDIPVSDTIALKKQTDILHAKIDKYMPFISKSFDSVFYKVVNEYPNNYHQSASYFIREKGNI